MSGLTINDGSRLPKQPKHAVYVEKKGAKLYIVRQLQRRTKESFYCMCGIREFYVEYIYRGVNIIISAYK